MKTQSVKVSALTGAALDYAVALAVSHGEVDSGVVARNWVSIASSGVPHDRYSPSSNWYECGWLVEKFGISINCMPGRIVNTFRFCCIVGNSTHISTDPKVAICRAAVESKLGPEIQIPVELMP